MLRREGVVNDVQHSPLNLPYLERDGEFFQKRAALQLDHEGKQNMYIPLKCNAICNHSFLSFDLINSMDIELANKIIKLVQIGH